MITREQIPSVLGNTAYDRRHRKLGRVGQVFIDDETGAPEWMTIQTGMLRGKEAFVPLAPAELRGDEIVLPFDQDQIKDAPKVETEAGHLAPAEEARLYEYYGMQYQPYAAEEPRPPTGEGPPEAPAAGPVTAERDVAAGMTREQRLERERLERESMERESMADESLEGQRLERERREGERLERERLDREAEAERRAEEEWRGW